MWPSAHQRVPRALQGRVRVPRALHGHEGRPTRLAPAPRALGAHAMSDDEQTQLETQPVRHGDAAGRNTKGRRKRLTRRKGKRK